MVLTVSDELYDDNSFNCVIVKEVSLQGRKMVGREIELP